MKKIEVLTPFVCRELGTVNGDVNEMRDDLAVRYEKDGLVRIIEPLTIDPNTIKPCNSRKTKAMKPNKNKGKSRK